MAENGRTGMRSNTSNHRCVALPLQRRHVHNAGRTTTPPCRIVDRRSQKCMQMHPLNAVALHAELHGHGMCLKMVCCGPSNHLLSQGIERISIQLHALHESNQLVSSKPTSNGFANLCVIQAQRGVPRGQKTIALQQWSMNRCAARRVTSTIV